MANKYFTIEEIQTMRFYELPNFIYNAILDDLKRLWGKITKRMLEILNNATVFELDQYVNIYRYIEVI